MSTDADAQPSLARGFETWLTQDPDAIALVVGDARWSRRDIAEMAERAVGSLLETGARPGSSVVAHYNTGAEEIALALAASRLACTFVPIPLRMGAYEISYVLEALRPVMFAISGDMPAQLLVPDSVPVRPLADLICGPRVDVPHAVAPEDHVPVIGFTSGSTGRPKGVMHSARSLAWTADRMAALASLQPGESICVAGAGAGAPGFTFFSYMPLTRGVTIVRAERWNPTRVLDLIESYQCVWSVMVPTMLYQLLEAQQAAGGRNRARSVRAVTVGGSFIGETLIHRARKELGIEVLRMYAMAECMASCSMELTDPAADRDGLDGRPARGAEVAVFDEEGNEVRPGIVGELGLRGPSLFEGYLGDPEGKAGRLTSGGFFLSGDLGHITDTGAVKVVGRVKDMIIRGGFNIDPSEVEEFIRKHDAVVDVAVVGYPDEMFGERACAVVKLCDGASLEFDDLVGYLFGLGLSKEKAPERLVTCDAFPTSPDGKILKAALRQRVADAEVASL